MGKGFFLLFLLLMVSAVSYGEKIKIAVGLALPPYVLEKTNNGIELDIVKECLKRAGHELEIKYLPFARVVKAIESKEVDAAMTILESSGVQGVYYSDSHISYQNVAVSLAEKNLKIENLNDLAKRNVIGFQNAKLYLGEDYKKAMDENKDYREMARQENQVALLFKGRTDVNVIDINIFKYFRQLTKKVDTSKKVTYHKLFPKTDYKIAFLDKKIKDSFNKALKEVKADGTYDKIFKKYIK